MHVVVVGATGNVGSSLVRLLAADPRVDSIAGVARRRPELKLPKTTWVVADIAQDDLDPVLREADVVVHLAWLIQPSHDGGALWRVNVEGSARLFDSVARVGAGALVYASSVGAYSPGPKDRFVDESWPTQGVRGSFYSRHKAEVERRLDAFEAANPAIRVVRLRPGLIFKRTAASGIRRLFAGPLLPGSALRPPLVLVVPDIRGLRAQAVHADDVAAAYLEAVLRDVRGAFNIAAPPPLDASVAARVLHARAVRMPAGLARSVVGVTWQLHLQPTPPGWVDLALAVPLMDTRRAEEELGWRPRHTAEDALRELLEGLREGAHEPTPPLARTSGGPLRTQELSTGVGERGDT